MDKKARDKLYLWTKNFGRDGFMRLQIFHLQRALNVRQKKLAVGEISLYDWSPVQQDWYWRPAVPTVILLPRMNIFWLTTAKATDQDWFTIHLRLLRWGRFQHYLWPGYFLLQSKDSMLDTCILRWGSTYKHFYPSKSYKGNIITKTRDQNSQLFGRKKTHV